MRGQWGLITGLVFVLIIAMFAVINVDPVEVNYLVNSSSIPLVLVILGSVLMGALIVGLVGMYKIYQLQREIKRLKAKMPSSPEPKPAVDEKKQQAGQNDQTTTKK